MYDAAYEDVHDPKANPPGDCALRLAAILQFEKAAFFLKERIFNSESNPSFAAGRAVVQKACLHFLTGSLLSA
jgi:hypothetical protein